MANFIEHEQVEYKEEKNTIKEMLMIQCGTEMSENFILFYFICTAKPREGT